MVSGNLSILFGYKGPSYAIVSAAPPPPIRLATPRLIEYGDADVMVAGGTEATICPLAIGGFSSAKACPPATTTWPPPAVRGTPAAMVL